MDQLSVRIRLVFADKGTFHAETITLPAELLDSVDRLIDLLREDPTVTRQLHVDLNRLVSAYVLEDE